jgi:ribosomal protein S27E
VRRGKKRDCESASARLVFAECAGCSNRTRVWDLSRGGVRPSVPAPSAFNVAVTDMDRRWTCPACGLFQVLPVGGVYVIYDRKKRSVLYIGRSVDVQRRLDWWQAAENRYHDQSRYRGVQLVTSGFLPEATWFAQEDRN